MNFFHEKFEMKLLQLTISVFIISLGQASLISINVGKQKKKEAGSTIKLRCNFDSSQVSSVVWTKTDGDKTVGGENNAGVGAVSLKFTDLQIQDSGNYTCSGKLADGNETSASVELIVYDPPTVGKTPRTQNFVIGTNATVVCRAEGDPKPRITWSWNDTFEKGRISCSGDNLVISNVTKADEGEYRCEAEQTSTAEFDDVTIQVVVNIPPKIHHRKKKRIVIAGESATLPCSATGDPTPTLSWYKPDGEGGLVKQSNSSKLTLDVEQSLDGASFVCVALNIAGNDTSPTKLIVHVKPTINITEKVTVIEGESTELQCDAQGIPTPTVVFYDTYLNDTIAKGKAASRESIRRPNFRKVSASDNETLGSWTPGLDITYEGNVGVMKFARIKYTDKGFYECYAENDAGHTSSYAELDVLYSPKPTLLYNKWACEDSDIVAELRCEANANPAANFTWYKYLPQDGAGEPGDRNEELVLLDESDLPTGFQIEQDEEDSLLLVNVSAASGPFGKYLCTATNHLGSSNETVHLWKATQPQPPYLVKVIEARARDAIIGIDVPVSLDYTPYTRITVTLTDEDDASIRAEDVEVETDKWYYTHHFTGLEHDALYFVDAVTENCEGISNTSEATELRTLRILEPEPVRITSDNLSDSFDRYTIKWMTEDLGGGDVKNITINLYKIQQVIDGTESDGIMLVDTFEVPVLELNSQNGLYKISGLSALSNYEIRVTVTNDVGNATTSHKFSTPAEPTTTTPEGGSHPDSGGSSMDKLPIIIVVAVLLGIVVIIDLSCCCLKDLGLSYVIYSHTCMRKPKKNADTEAGAAQFSRQDDDQDDKAVIVDEEKRPLADDMEPATNGDPALSKIEESEEPGASNNKENVSSPNGNGTAEGATESPDISNEHNE